MVGKTNVASNPSLRSRAGEIEFEASPSLPHDLFDNREAETSPRCAFRASTLEAAFQLCKFVGANGRPIIDDTNGGPGANYNLNLAAQGAVTQRVVDKVLQRNSECIGIDGHNQALARALDRRRDAQPTAISSRNPQLLDA